MNIKYKSSKKKLIFISISKVKMIKQNNYKLRQNSISS